ncbi:MAG: GNAT family N-acetyltransferase [Candidatus Heimdallarchaeota archaeon]|nr:GNAT family N-acetyltransferase [Candidatus Heimdallarchaeota archaeon]MCK5049478.1 GNAT family N-acetyltransferase [Candidatus Heimdallarchaeota archaeon]
MVKTTYSIKQFDCETCSEGTWDHFFKHWQPFYKDAYPHNRVPERDLQIKRMSSKDPYTDHHRWLLFNDDNRCIGYWYLGYVTKESPTYETNKHIAEFFLSLDKEYRQKGIGTEIIQKSIDYAKAQNRSIIQCWAGTEAGKISCERWGFILKNEHIGNKLNLAEVDWDLMKNWTEEGKRKAKKVVIEQFSIVPEKDIEEFTRLYTETINQAPWDGEGQDNVTPKRRRHDEQEYIKKGYDWITLITREENGVISGLTEIFYNPLEPEVIAQELTGVNEQYRGRSLGKWLKAEMLFYVRDKYPKIEYISTSNADTNASMLSINTRLGFKRVSAWYVMELNIKSDKH